MNKTLLASLIATLVCAPAVAAGVCDGKSDGKTGCAVPEQAGKARQDSHVLTRPIGAVAPSVEYRRPNEVVVVSRASSPVATPAASSREVPVLANRPGAKPTVLPLFGSGFDLLSQPERDALSALAQRLAGKPGLRLRLTGHADVQRMTPATRKRFGDNQGLSQARATQVQDFLRGFPGMAAVPMEVLGRGDTVPLQSCDAKAAYAGNEQDMIDYKACLAPNRRVEIEVWYDQQVGVTTEAVPVPAVAPPPQPAPPACKDQLGGDAGLPFRISVDGVPLARQDLPNSADTTRCTDVALEKADIQLRFDGLEATPVLNLTVHPDAAVRGAAVRFTPYSNYAAFISKAEVRVFAADDSTQKTPLAVIALDPRVDTVAQWTAPQDRNAVQYLLRVYDAQGRFDESRPKTLRLLDARNPLADEEPQPREDLIGYGENHRHLKNIPVRGGAVTVNGDRLAPGSAVTVLGRAVPVDAQGKFALRQILPPGRHVVDIATQSGGQRAEFKRHIYIPHNDWFYVALADLTIGQNRVTGPAQLVTGDTSRRYEEKIHVDGRLAFYLKGKIKGETLLTASADTREQPIGDLFSNFNSKDPRYLLRRLDPNAYYPVYGDDSTLVEDAPTQGKFYVKLQRNDSHVLWGSFQTKLSGTDLVNYSRGLYGAQARYQSSEATAFGERRSEVDLFAADPGTLASVEEFRGTGGSLYYLRNQDILVGSERLRVEVRDKDSGIVLKSTTLVHGQDYELNSLQGRVILRTPLAATASADTLVLSGALSGHPTYLVVGYEFTPGLTAAENLTLGGRASHWLGDRVKLGITGYRQDGVGTEQELLGADLTLRYQPGTYLKLETAQSSGPGNGALSSQNGGFNFGTVAQTTTAGIEAQAHRVEAAADLRELGATLPGSVNAYWVKREDGYSAPGQITSEGIEQIGVQGKVQASDKLELLARVDRKDGRLSGANQSAEVNATYAVTPSVAASLGVRRDERETALAAGASAILAETGARTDVAAKLAYHPVDEKGQPGRWGVYGLLQGTAQHDASRSENDRIAVGAQYQVNDRANVSGEISEGDGGAGAKLALDYRLSDRSSVYLNYLLDPDRSDTGHRARVGGITAGVKSRYSDSLSVYTESRYQEAANGSSGLIHAFGLDLAASDRWTLGARLEQGSSAEPATGDLERSAMSLSAGYRFEKIRYTGVIEYRTEDGNQSGQRESWLLKNTLGYQATPDWRLLGRLNLARSQARAGSTGDANFTEGVLGLAYRPVLNDRLNALFKYTYLSDLPSPGQVGAAGAVNVYEQRSHVLSVDAIYDLMPRLSVGGKLGYRFGELRDTSQLGGNWFRSSAWLAIARVDWHVVHKWDIMGELRHLAAEEAQDAKSGALLGVYRHINPNVKLGLGYNFTTFSDDLTDMSYRSRGWFVNLLGKL
ncbi:MAG: flagellar motor protein MotB [Comamonadaceae bacterium]|nr:flagellar motor protein MotB [Comamonadaceae bacterium]